MKNLLIIVFFWIIQNAGYSQIPEKKSLSKDEQYCEKLQENGEFSSFVALVLDEKEKDASNNSEEIKIYFPEGFYLEGINGNKYAICYLENNSPKSINILRIDSTIDKVKQYFYVNGKWIQGKTNRLSDCGNSYFVKELSANKKIEFQLDINTLTFGNVKIPFKISIEIEGKIIESNVIEVSLHKKQVEQLLASK